MPDKLFHIDKKLFRFSIWLWIKFYWYKYIRKVNIIGFYGGKPIIMMEDDLDA